MKSSGIKRLVCAGTLAAAFLIGAGNAQTLSLDSLQKRYVAMKYGMFLHFNMGTFTVEEWATPGQNPNTFNPTSLNCGQWADAAVAGGMKYMVLTTKHHDGFCIWPSAYTTYTVGSSSWRSGRGDVVKEFSDSCRSRGLAVCFYYSIWDRTSGQDTTFIKRQLTELLTNYGPVAALWFDGWGWQIPYTSVPYAVIQRLIKSIQPNCLIINNDQTHSFSTSEIIGWEKGGHQSTTIPVNNTSPSELCETISSDNKWFYPGPTMVNNVIGVAEIVALLKECNMRNTNLLLDVTPDQRGMVPQSQVNRLIQVKPYVDIPNLALNQTVLVSNFYQNDTQYNGAKAVDGSWESRWATNNNITSAWLEVDFAAPTRFNSVIWGECTDYGQRIRGYQIQYWNGSAWTTLVTGTIPVFPAELDTFPVVQASRIRLNITSISGTQGPTVWDFQMYCTAGQTEVRDCRSSARRSGHDAAAQQYRLVVSGLNAGRAGQTGISACYDLRGKRLYTGKNRASARQGRWHLTGRQTVIEENAKSAP